MKNYENNLPPDYKVIYTIDAKDTKFAILFNLASVIIMAVVLVILCFFFRITLQEAMMSFSKLSTFLFILSLFPLIILHELTHGAAYRCLTHQKLTYGFTGSVAYCGVPNIYVYKKAALISLLAPFLLFSLIMVLGLLFSSPEFKFDWIFILSVHVGSCIGDLYDTLLILFRFKGNILMNDTGPKQTFYSNTEQ